MISLPKDIAAVDVNQWLESGWFFFEMDGEFIPATIESLPGFDLERPDSFVVRLLGGKSVASTNLQAIHPHWPVCGAVNVEERRVAVYMERLQRKQFCRTYTHRLINMTVPGQTLIGKHLTERLYPTSDAVVRGVFFPTYFTLSEILEEKFAGKGWASCAVSPHVIVLKQRPRNLIFYRGEVAGYLAGRKLEDVTHDMVPHLLKHFHGDVYV